MDFEHRGSAAVTWMVSFTYARRPELRGESFAAPIVHPDRINFLENKIFDLLVEN